MKSKFGKIISVKDINDICKKIQKLSLENLKQLWEMCGWNFSENIFEQNKRFKKIREDLNYAKKQVLNLLLETPSKEFFYNLEKLSVLS